MRACRVVYIQGTAHILQTVHFTAHILQTVHFSASRNDICFFPVCFTMKCARTFLFLEENKRQFDYAYLYQIYI